MISPPSSHTQVALLLTAPLLIGRGDERAELLTPSEYRRLAVCLRDMQVQPGALLSREAEQLFQGCAAVIEEGRLRRLLARGFLLGQALERWEARAIWVVSLSDPEYPRRLKIRLRADAPPVLYGCGDLALLETGGLAVVGSRHVSAELLEYTLNIGRLSASARRTVVSGGARGVDQAAVSGALEEDGAAVAMLADGLERAALAREHRRALREGRLALVSPYDPLAGFNVGNAMRRNKLIYGLADAALVINADLGKGGTWAGAVEQLEKLRFVPVYTRSIGEPGEGLRGLLERGATAWPNPETPSSLVEVLTRASTAAADTPVQRELFPPQDAAAAEAQPLISAAPPQLDALSSETPPPSKLSPEPAEVLFSTVRDLLRSMQTPKSDSEIATYLNVSKSQAKEWISRLLDEGVMQKQGKPIRYGPKAQPSLLES